MRDELIPAQETDELINPVNAETAAEMLRLYKTSAVMQKIQVYLMKRGEAWKHIRNPETGKYCQSFEELCEVLELPERTAYNWIYQVQVTANVMGFNLKVATVATLSEENLLQKLLPVRDVNALLPIKDAKLQRRAWEEFQTLRNQDATQKDSNLKKVVALYAPQKANETPSRPDPLEQAMQAQSTAPPAEPLQLMDALGVAAPVIKSFTPPADPEPESEPVRQLKETFDFAGVLADVETLVEWLKLEEVPGAIMPQTIKGVMASCDSAARWLEEQL